MTFQRTLSTKSAAGVFALSPRLRTLKYTGEGGRRQQQATTALVLRFWACAASPPSKGKGFGRGPSCLGGCVWCTETDGFDVCVGEGGGAECARFCARAPSAARVEISIALTRPPGPRGAACRRCSRRGRGAAGTRRGAPAAPRAPVCNRPQTQGGQRRGRSARAAGRRGR
jgi:hypothetical protein